MRKTEAALLCLGLWGCTTTAIRNETDCSIPAGAERVPAAMACSKIMSANEEKLPDSEVIQSRDPNEVSFAKQMTAETSAYLDRKPELRKKIAARAGELVAQNAPMMTNYFGVTFKMSSGNLVQVGTNGSQDRTLVAVAGLPKGSSIVSYQLSPDKTKLAYAYSVYGSDWATWKFLNMADLSPIDSSLFIKQTGGDEPRWSRDSSGFFYLNWTTADRDAQGDRNPVLKYHELGAPRGKDLTLFDDREHTSKYSVREMADGNLIVYRFLGAQIPLSVYLLRSKGGRQYEAPLPLVVPNADFGAVLGVVGTKVILQSSKLGSKYGIYTIDTAVRTQDPAAPFKTETLVPADGQKVMALAQMIGNRLVLQYLNARLENIIEIRDLSGNKISSFKPSDLGYPDWGTLSPVTGDMTSEGSTHFTYSSVTMPTETFKIDLANGAVQPVPGKPVNFDASKVKTDFVMYESADGTQIPMWVYSRTDLSEAPRFAYMWSYGAIGSNNTPNWSKKYQMMLELGGIVAIPAARGGGEFGLDWQKAGTGGVRDNRVKTFQDVSAASHKLHALFPGIQVIRGGRSYGGAFTLAQYGLHSADFDSFIAVVPAADLNRELFHGVEWTHFDDMGFPRDPRTGRLLPQYLNPKASVVRDWNPIDAAARTSAPKPLIVFVTENDTRVLASTGIQTVMRLKQKFPNAPIYLYEHPNGGHMARSETAEEAAFVAVIYDVDLKPLTR